MDNEDFVAISQAEENLKCHLCGKEASSLFIPQTAAFICENCRVVYDENEIDIIPIKKVSIFKLSDEQLMLLIKNYLQPEKEDEIPLAAFEEDSLNQPAKESDTTEKESKTPVIDTQLNEINETDTENLIQKEEKSKNDGLVQEEENLQNNELEPQEEISQSKLFSNKIHEFDEEECNLTSIVEESIGSGKEFISKLETYNSESTSSFDQFGNMAIDSIFDLHKVNSDSPKKSLQIVYPKPSKKHNLTQDDVFETLGPVNSINLLTEDYIMEEKPDEYEFINTDEIIPVNSPAIFPSNIEASIMEAYLNFHH